jgi:hypothetical protein
MRYGRRGGCLVGTRAQIYYFGSDWLVLIIYGELVKASKTADAEGARAKPLAAAAPERSQVSRLRLAS